MAWSSDLKTTLKTLNQEAVANGGMCPKTMTGINIHFMASIMKFQLQS
jgi:hypothetical protein